MTRIPSREAKREKALRYIAEERVQVLSANDHGIRLEVRGSCREPYIVRLGRDGRGAPVADCTCVHPKPTCRHLEVARLLRRD